MAIGFDDSTPPQYTPTNEQLTYLLGSRILIRPVDLDKSCPESSTVSCTGRLSLTRSLPRILLWLRPEGHVAAYCAKRVCAEGSEEGYDIGWNEDCQERSLTGRSGESKSQIMTGPWWTIHTTEIYLTLEENRLL